MAIGLPKYLKKERAKIDKDASIVFVLPPINIGPKDTEAGQQGHEFLNKLAKSVDRFSVMTYDHSRVGEQIAPIAWVRQVISSLKAVDSVSQKLLLGLPMYGWRGREGGKDGEDMTAEKMILWLAQEKSVVVAYDEATQEHRYIDSKGRRCSYPSPLMLQVSLGLRGYISIQCYLVSYGVVH